MQQKKISNWLRRFTINCLSLFMMAWLGLSGDQAQAAGGWDYKRSEFIIISGGPAIRRWENLRVRNDQHDRWWGNFIRAARIRIQQIRRAHGDEARITWFVFRPGYVSRAAEDAECTIDKITSVRDAYKLNMVWFETTEQLITSLNSRPSGSVVNFEFFGHSNRDCWMFDYSADISGASTVFLHETEVGKINTRIFSKLATIKSWGCHTGESMSKFWKRAHGIPMEGAIGKTDYTAIIDHVSLPRVNGRWTR